MSDRMLRLAVLISGSGRTLQNFIRLMERGDLPVEIRLVISSTPRAGGLRFAHEAEIPTQVFSRRDARDDRDYSEKIFHACRDAEIDYVAMAGFLKFLLIPPDFENRVLNIHPALLPAFGGPGMYGHHVHQAVLAAEVPESGCTVHWVDNQYDHGPILLQRRVEVRPGDTSDTLADRVFQAELIAYPEVLRDLHARR